MRLAEMIAIKPMATLKSSRDPSAPAMRRDIEPEYMSLSISLRFLAAPFVNSIAPFTAIHSNNDANANAVSIIYV